MGDHPREYGENLRTAFMRHDMVGSSPRIRGKRDGDDVFGGDVGIIPANTGRIHSCCFLVFGQWDHPREYGENAAVGSFRMMNSGSSPRIRGE